MTKSKKETSSPLLQRKWEQCLKFVYIPTDDLSVIKAKLLAIEPTN